MQTRATWDQTQFNQILKAYMAHSSRDVVTAMNTKGFYIARAATRMTYKAGKERIETGLGTVVTVTKTSKSGRTYNRKSLDLNMGTTHTDAPLAALIINARMGRSKKPGLYGSAMKAAIKKMISARKRSNAFLASGWIDAIKKLEPLADRGKKPQMAPASEMRRYGVAKGDATPAVMGPVIAVKLENKAETKRDKKDALGKYASAGLAQAFESEANSMMQYIEQKLAAAAAAANRQLGP